MIYANGGFDNGNFLQFHGVETGCGQPRRSTIMKAFLALSCVCVGIGAAVEQENSTFVFIADTHLGEGCSTAPTGYEANDTDCYSVADLRRTISRVNELKPSFVIVGGDITSSAQQTEFDAAKHLLDQLEMPYIPVMGNHDIWSYDQVVGDRTSTPAGDVMFAQTFSDVFTPFMNFSDGSFVYPNTSVYNPPHKCNSSFQSWRLHAGGLAGDAVFGDDPNFDGKRHGLTIWVGRFFCGE